MSKKRCCDEGAILRNLWEKSEEPLHSFRPEILQWYEERKADARSAWTDHLRECPVCNPVHSKAKSAEVKLVHFRTT
jgi:hypothetical protein